MNRRILIVFSIVLIVISVYLLSKHYKKVQLEKYVTNLSIYGKVRCFYTNGDSKNDLIWNLPVDSINSMEISNANSMLYLSRFNKINKLEIKLKKIDVIQFLNNDSYIYAKCKDTLLDNRYYRYIDSIDNINSLLLEGNEYRSEKTKEIFKYLLDSSSIKKKLNSFTLEANYLDTLKYDVVFDSEEWNNIEGFDIVLPRSIFDYNINFFGNFKKLKQLKIAIDDDSEFKKYFNVKAVSPKLTIINLEGVFLNKSLNFKRSKDNFIITSDSLKQLICYLKSEEHINFHLPSSKNLNKIYFRSSDWRYNKPIILNIDSLRDRLSIEELFFYSSLNQISKLDIDSLNNLRVFSMKDFTKVKLEGSHKIWNKNLRELRLYNELKDFPNSIENIDSLKILDLNLSESPRKLSSIQKCSSLKEIRMTFKNFDDALELINSAERLKLVKINIGIDANISYSFFSKEKKKLENHINDKFPNADVLIENGRLGYYLNIPQ